MTITEPLLWTLTEHSTHCVTVTQGEAGLVDRQLGSQPQSA